MGLVIWFYIFLQLLLSIFVFEFQRITLSIAREANNSVAQFQTIMTPNWIGVLSWVSHLLGLLSLLAIYHYYSITWALVFLIVSQFGLTFIGKFFSPYLHTYNLRIIKTHLQEEINNSKDLLKTNFLKEILVNINNHIGRPV